jgi:hypothetical protein
MPTSVREFLRQSVVLRSLRIIPSENRKKVILATVLQIGLAILDLVGVAAIGVIVDDNCGPCPLINGVIVKNPVSVFCGLALVTQLEYGV